MSTEIWKPVPNHETSYEVSNLGRVRSLDRVVRCGYGKTRLHRGRVLTGRKSCSTDHRRIAIHGKDYAVHRLVLLAFVGPCPEGMECCHGDDDPTNNQLANLRWDTRQANRDDMVRNGRSGRGERAAHSVLTEADVLAIRRRCAAGTAQKALAAEYGVDPSAVSLIVRRKRWTHI